MEKLNLYLNDDQYARLCILAKEVNAEPEEYANNEFYDLIILKWLKHKERELEKVLNDPGVDWED